MSLIRVRRERRELGHRAKRPPSLVRLLVLLLLVGALIWYLGRFT
jgi:flagellar biogenesis protein FliO